jgi:CTP synthase (UTP-ammonia lyase)
MTSSIQIGLIGDHDATVKAHMAIPKALELAAKSLNVSISPIWIHTSSVSNVGDQELLNCQGVWCVPASPYASMEGALLAIRFARETKRPFLGTCGGFQHAVLEFARNVLGQSDADHAECNPAASLPIISPLSCSLVEASGRILFQPGSRIAQIYGRQEAIEEYHCSYGVNPRFSALLDGSALKITGTDDQGEVRVVELDNHPFFLATLFQPERSALKNQVHPLIAEFVRACQNC